MRHIIFEDKKVYPSKIVCVGRNYTKHIQELKNKDPEEIVLFIKPNSSISEDVYKPELSCRYEGEISLIFEKGQPVGVGFGIDLTLVEEQNRLKQKGLPWEKAKAFDRSAVFSKFVRISPDKIEHLRMELWINGDLKQSGRIKDMIYSPDQILKEAKRYFSFYDYDILMCGTPEGVGFFNKGDIFEGKVFLENLFLTGGRWKVK
ncbi:fumarylacetoacetate hydrolase family protein [Persephonella sp.]